MGIKLTDIYTYNISVKGHKFSLRHYIIYILWLAIYTGHIAVPGLSVCSDFRQGSNPL